MPLSSRAPAVGLAARAGESLVADRAAVLLRAVAHHARPACRAAVGPVARVGRITQAPRRLARRLESAGVPDGADTGSLSQCCGRPTVDRGDPDGSDQGFTRPRPQLHPSKELLSI